MSSSEEPVFLVNVYSTPAIVCVVGRATYVNSAHLREFFQKLLADFDKDKFLIDFTDCTGMDSTFMGIVAGVALQLKRRDPQGELTLCGLSEKNRELITNLGLHKICNVSDDAVCRACLEEHVPDSSQLDLDKKEKTKLLLEAHETLIEMDSANKSKFQDVVSFLRSEL